MSSRSAFGKALIKRVISATTAGVAVGALTVVSASPAQAATCSPNHCYGLISWPHGNIAGAEVELGTYLLDPFNDVDQIATSEFWIGFDDPSGAGNNLWLEFGEIHGTYCNRNMSWFSAIQRSPDNFVLQCHGAAAESNTKHVLRADEPFDGTWNLYRNGSLVTAYGSAPTGTQSADVGTEISHEVAHTSMTGGKLRFKFQSTGQWASGWASTNYPAGNSNSAGWPCYSLWVSKPTDMRARCNIAQSAVTSVTTYPHHGPDAPATEAMRLASLNGSAATIADGSRAARSVRTTRAQAFSAMSIADNGTSAATVIQVEGTFDGRRIPAPRGADKPTGNVMTFVFDANGEMLAMQLTRDKPFELSTLGQVRLVAA